MIRKFTLALLLPLATLALALPLSAAELSDTEAAKLTTQIETLLKSFNEGDADALIDHTHPSILKLAGSKETFEKLTKDAVAMVSQQGIKFLETTCSKPSQF